MNVLKLIGSYILFGSIIYAIIYAIIYLIIHFLKKKKNRKIVADQIKKCKEETQLLGQTYIDLPFNDKICCSLRYQDSQGILLASLDSSKSGIKYNINQKIQQHEYCEIVSYKLQLYHIDESGSFECIIDDSKDFSVENFLENTDFTKYTIMNGDIKASIPIEDYLKYLRLISNDDSYACSAAFNMNIQYYDLNKLKTNFRSMYSHPYIIPKTSFMVNFSVTLASYYSPKDNISRLSYHNYSIENHRFTVEKGALYL